MADVSQVITLGIGTPSDIAHLTLFGLSPNTAISAPAVLTIAGVYQDTITVPGWYQDALDVPGHYQAALDVPGRLE